MTSHQKRYRTDQEFAQREKDRAAARYKNLDEIEKKRVYISCTIYRLVESRDRKIMQANELDVKITDLKKEREGIKWLIYERRKSVKYYFVCCVCGKPGTGASSIRKTHSECRAKRMRLISSIAYSKSKSGAEGKI